MASSLPLDLAKIVRSRFFERSDHRLYLYLGNARGHIPAGTPTRTSMGLLGALRPFYDRNLYFFPTIFTGVPEGSQVLLGPCYKFFTINLDLPSLKLPHTLPYQVRALFHVLLASFRVF
jgi:hypothetical protein